MAERRALAPPRLPATLVPQAVSQLGSQVSQLALPLAAILVLDASAFEVALLGTVEFLPFLLFALPAGVWVDRLPRKPILVLGDLGRAAALASVPLAYAFDALTIWQLYAVGFVVGVCTVFFDVAYQSTPSASSAPPASSSGSADLRLSRSRLHNPACVASSSRGSAICSAIASGGRSH